MPLPARQAAAHEKDHGEVRLSLWEEDGARQSPALSHRGMREFSKTAERR